MKPLVALLALSFSLSVVSCDKSGPIPIQPYEYPMYGQLGIDRFTRIDSAGSIYMERVGASFYKPSSDFFPTVPAGEVTLNGAPVGFDGMSRFYIDSSAAPSLPILDRARYNVWRVGGSGEIPGFVDSVPALKHDLTLMAPLPQVHPLLSYPLIIQWNEPNEPGVYIRITVTAPTDSIPGGFSTTTFRPTNSGEFIIPSSYMRSRHWVAGPLTIYVEQGRSEDAVTSDRKRFVMKYETRIELHTRFEE